MADNHTNANSSALLDAGSVSFKCLKPLESCVMVGNVISFFINTFHLWVISQLGTLKGTPYCYVLINITLADILHNVASIIFYSCYEFFIVNLNYGEPELRAPIRIVTLCSHYVGFHVFLLASMEKYLAICTPFSYESSVIIRRLPVNFVLVWLYIFSLSTVLTLTEVLNLTPWMNSAGNVVILTICFAVTPNTLSGTLLIKVYRELKRMRNRSQNSSDNDGKTKTSMYLIIIFTLEIIVFLLNSICVITLYTTGESVLCHIWNAFIKAPCTILNAVIYGWRTQSYRQHVRRVFGCNRSQIGNVEG